MSRKQSMPLAGVLLPILFSAGCAHSGSATTEHAVGDKVVIPPLSYVVIESDWHSQLGDAFKIRSPEQRFMEIALSITNAGNSDVSIPLLTLENSQGQSFVESDSGDGVDNWLGLIRTIKPAQTEMGKVLFDVPLASYRLRLTDGGGPGAEKYAWVSVPLRIDVDTGVPSPGSSGIPAK